MFKKFPHIRQLDEMDCGPACLQVISKYYGKDYSLEFLRSLAFTGRQGSSMLNICEAAEKLGFKATGIRIGFENLKAIASAPFICYWNQKHFVVVYKITDSWIYVSDPAFGLVKYKKEDFLKSWSVDNVTGIVARLELTPQFGKTEDTSVRSKSGFIVLFKYIRNYKKTIFQIFLGLIAASILQLTLPFLTQSIVDTGIKNSDYHFIYLILLAQLFIFVGRTFLEVVRSHLLLYISSRVNISLLSDFFIKLMNLPIGYYDRKMTGDIMQRINDHTRVETFITSGLLTIVFSIINILVFVTVLAFYNLEILLVFLTGSIIYFVWIRSFATRRAILDAKSFATLVSTNEKNIEMLTGMQEIKLGNAERKKRWEWEHIKMDQFRINLKSLYVKQLQIDIASVINELKNVVIAFVAAKLVIEGSISLGVMLSISFIIGQLNAPVLLITQFLQDSQDAKLSLKRINEIHDMDEEGAGSSDITRANLQHDIRIDNLSFKYSNSPSAPYILKDVDLVIPQKKITAIVGASGSGKTTLIKLLLQFYAPQQGSVKLGNDSLRDLNCHFWRNKCGVVMQEGYIFNDTIGNNIALGNDIIDEDLLIESCRIANIYDFVRKLPLGFMTKIGSTGLGLSTGQKQRILIARAVYKRPEFIFFDEATSALDANNEKQIMNNLDHFFKGKTVVIVAHRLSTVLNADQIVVLKDGQIIERGAHNSLVEQRGDYFNLIKNQLELGK